MMSFIEAWQHGIVIECFDGIFRGFILVFSHIRRTTLKSKFTQSPLVVGIF
jgi:hypothetical protein